MIQKIKAMVYKRYFNEIVPENSNYSNDFIEKTLELISYFHCSLRAVAFKVEKDTKISVSHWAI
ncbi:MAG: hypothetical protein FWH54_06700 [Methanobrevibacter sp.]|nr:hypothetical protein [Methanobrevibacter sp.]